jgi:hypothetical protein
MPDVTNGIFSDHCYNQMWELFKTPEDEVGSKFTGDRRGRSLTDCIRYCKNVLSYGHNQINRGYAAERIMKIPVPMGKKLALFLVNEAHYWNPDVRNERKGDPEHSSSYKNMVLAKNSYYDIPISGVIIDYNKEVKTTKRVWNTIPVITCPPFVGQVPSISVPVGSTVVSTDNTAILEKLSQVKFAYGISRGGDHTWLFSFGEVFEVPFEEEGAKLYGKKLLKNFNWFSGCILTPQDSTFVSDPI